MVEHRFQFSAAVDPDEIEATLLLSLLACESLHGSARVRLEVTHTLDRAHRCCTIRGATPVSRDLAKLFAGYLSAEFGAQGFEVTSAEASIGASAS